MAEGRVQRRLAAILAADVVGYGRLIEADEEGTRARLKSLHAELIEPRIKADGGRIVKTMGDGILVEFPSAVDAIRNALAIQNAMSGRDSALPEECRIVFRVGINVGDVIVEGSDIHGDGVNVAARLEGLCGPGEVYVSGTVYDQAAGKLAVSFEDLGEQAVKSISRPVRVYRARTDQEDVPLTPIVDEDGTFSVPDKPSIAVLPFDNMSGDEDQTYFSDGITEDIITELSRFRTLFVIARNSSFAFRGQSIEVSEIGRRLGVQYLVEGSVRKAGNRIRVTAQLVDASTGHHLWAERYDRDLEDIFAVQDEITEAIVSMVPGRMEVDVRDRAERKPTSNMTAYDYFLLGTQQLWAWTPDSLAEAGRLAQQAVSLDSRFARAHALLAATHLWAVPLQAGRKGALDDALKHAETAAALDDEDSWTRAMLGLTLYELGEDEDAETQCRHAVALTLDRWHRALLAACFAQVGRVNEARTEIDMFVAARHEEIKSQGRPIPTDNLELAAFRANRYRRQEERDHFLDGLRKAGL
jgi:TolB-like protein